MSRITKGQFQSVFTNSLVDLRDDTVATAAEAAGLDLTQADRLDGKLDGQVMGKEAIAKLYDLVDALDGKAAGLASSKERAIYKAFQAARVASQPITAEQGQALANAALEMLDREARDSHGTSRWALDGAALCRNPALSSPTYARAQEWKCNVFVGEAFHKAGLPFPINSEKHYVSANRIPRESAFFQAVGRLSDIQLGDLVSIGRKGGSGHVEIVTGVDRDPHGKVTALRTVGAHQSGLAEGTATADPLVRLHGRSPRASEADGGNGVVIGGETFRILRPKAPPLAAQELSTQLGVPLKG